MAIILDEAERCAALASARNNMVGPLLDFANPDHEKLFWASPATQRHLFWLDRWGLVTSIIVNLSMAVFCALGHGVSLKALLISLAPTGTALLAVAQLVWMARSPQSYIYHRTTVALFHCFRFLATYGALVEPGMALRLQHAGSWRQFQVLLLLTPMCCVLHALAHPITFKLQVGFVVARHLLDRLYLIPVFITISRLSGYTNYCEKLCNSVERAMMSITVGLGGAPEMWQDPELACAAAGADNLLFTMTTIVGHVLAPLLLSYFYEQSLKIRHGETLMQLPRSIRLPPAVGFGKCVMYSTGWLMMVWAFAASWPVRV